MNNRRVIKLLLITALVVAGAVAGVRVITNGDKVDTTPLPSPGKDEPLEEAKVKVLQPLPNELVTSPLEVVGEARGYWFFEASFPVRLEDKDRKVVASGIAQAQDEWMTEAFVPFRATLTFTVPAANEPLIGNLVLVKDNPSGLPEHDDEFRMPVQIATSFDTTTMQVYFGNTNKNPGTLDCSLVFGVDRVVPKVPQIAREALAALLKGPTQEEKEEGYFTSINDGVVVEKMAVDAQGVARAEFSPRLEEAVGGSCRVAAIHAQIEKTLKQFPTIKEVVISIDGRTEDILQP
ncbi:MAG: GerMN domain-containing protein [Patescibacteria group bacterium]